MNNQRTYPARWASTHQPYTLALLAGLLALFGACTANRMSMATGQKLRLSVGEIKEVALATRPDTTWQLTATSDNQEVVDVSRKPPVVATGTVTPTTGSAVFLIKGVTAGTAKVVFTEKQPGTDGSGQMKKAYVVIVTSK